MSQSVIDESRAFEKEYDNLMAPQNNVTPTINETDHTKYVMPTLIILPLVISAILVLASQAQWSIKIIVTILIIISMIMYNLRNNNVDFGSYLKPKQTNIN
jgi:hypothetical protein